VTNDNQHPIKWGDAQQYHAEPHSNYQGPDVGVMPTVKVLAMTHDPLGAIAALAAMYEGVVIRDLDDVTDERRAKAFHDVQQTHLKAPLEACKIHMLVEGVDRSFTHQQVRQRTAVFAQESLRFAVPGRLEEATSLPPSLHPAGWDEPDHMGEGVPIYSDQQKTWREIWFNVLSFIDVGYPTLVETGMPAEEARGLLPHATATRDHWVTDLRNLSDHAGNRLCTQAQFHWRIVFAEILKAMIQYGIDHDPEHKADYESLARSPLFRPVCYQLGHCPFNASFDRGCTIRDRVEQFARHGVASEHWDKDCIVPVLHHTEGERGEEFTIPAIHMTEWLADPGAARK
jgi:thymidylate synthase ThyX